MGENIKIGDRVSLPLNNTPAMMVDDVYEDANGKKFATCIWFDAEDRTFKKQDVAVALLIVTN